MLSASLPPEDEVDRLEALRSFDILDTDAEAAFDRIVTLAARITRCPIALVSFVDAERQWFKARIGVEVAETRRAHYSFCAHMLLNPHDLLIVPDAAQDRRFADNPFVAGEAGIRFYAGAPLVCAKGHVLGSLCVMDHRPRELDLEQLDSLVRLSWAVIDMLQMRRAIRSLRVAAVRGSLTGVPDRMALVDMLLRGMAQIERYGFPFALLQLGRPAFQRFMKDHNLTLADTALRELAADLMVSARGQTWRPALPPTSARQGW